MIKSVMILKRGRGRQGPSLRTLRRAMRPVRGRMGWRVLIFLILLTLVVGAIGITLNLKLEAWEREHPLGAHGK
ncbi:MAG TPA: hypothetical protein VHC39_13035 [Rhizomicrobium sp.]|nr:hypothetical protein [Rhizomicrobium sp.]